MRAPTGAPVAHDLADLGADVAHDAGRVEREAYDGREWGDEEGDEVLWGWVSEVVVEGDGGYEGGARKRRGWGRGKVRGDG